MNAQLTPPPDHDLRPATRNRQRDELIAIVDHESVQTTHRRRLVPLAAAAAVVVVIAGLAFAVPALRGDDAQPPVSGAGSAKPAVEPLTSTQAAEYGKACQQSFSPSPQKPGQTYTVTDGFKWVNPPADSHAIAWVVVTYESGSRHQVACGFDAEGKRTEQVWASSGETKMAAIDKTAAGGGTYVKSITRVTIAVGTGPATEAVLRNGFFFAPIKYVDTPGPLKLDEAPTYTLRAYDADGQVVYASAKTVREQQAQLDGCYTNPEGTKVVMVFGGRKGTPPVSQCKRGVAWNW